MTVKILFITGTDTGVGKTLLTALLLTHLRGQGLRAFALKPFCSGSHADAQLLWNLQNRELTLDQVNPFYFPEPVAPLVSARKRKRRIPLSDVVRHIHAIALRLVQAPASPEKHKARYSKNTIQPYLLIEGSGGLLVPLGAGYTVRDLIVRLDCEVIVVSRNRLGTINHTLLTIEALRPLHSALKVVLMDSVAPDLSSRSNAVFLSELLAPIPLYHLPFLGPRCCSPAAVHRNASKLTKVLARISGLGNGSEQAV